MSDTMDFESRDTPFPVALAGMIGIAKALFEGFYGVLGIAVASSVDDSFGTGALVFGIVYLIASILLLRGSRVGYYAMVVLSVIGLVGAVVYMFSSGGRARRRVADRPDERLRPLAAGRQGQLS